MLHIEVHLVSDTRALGSLNGLRAEEGRDSDEEEPERKPAEEHGGEEERVCDCQRFSPSRLCRRGDSITRTVTCRPRIRFTSAFKVFTYNDRLPSCYGLQEHCVLKAERRDHPGRNGE